MINKLILGTVQMGIDYGINNSRGKMSSEEATEILGAAYNAGIQMLDSAELYGNAHELIGAYHKDNASFRVITKFPKESVDIRLKVEKYLNDLNLETLEAILFHSFDSLEVNLGNISLLEELKKEGKIIKIGVSVYSNEEFKKATNYEFIDIIQLPYNLFDNFRQRGRLMRYAKEKGKEIHSRSAFLQGLFFMDSHNENTVARGLRNELALINKIANNCNLSIAELALSYCVCCTEIDKVIIGVDTLEQIEDNVKNLHQLDNDTMEKIERIEINNLELLNPSNWI